MALACRWRSRPQHKQARCLQLLSLLNTWALRDFLPNRNFADYACMQILRPLVFQSHASIEHFGLNVPLLQNFLGCSRKPIDDRIWRRCRGEKHQRSLHHCIWNPSFSHSRHVGQVDPSLTASLDQCLKLATTNVIDRPAKPKRGDIGRTSYRSHHCKFIAVKRSVSDIDPCPYLQKV